MGNASYAVLLLTLCAGGAQATELWDNPDDIPVSGPVTVGLAGEEPADIVRYLLAKGATDIELSPDGRTLAFEWAITGEPQLWSVPASGGFPSQLTYGSGITFFAWSPDGEQLLVSRDAEGNEREGYYLLARDGSTERVLLPQSSAFRSFGTFSPDGGEIVYSSTERNGRDYDIYVADVASGETRRVFEGRYGYYPDAWQPGGSLVVVTEARGEDAQDVYLLDVADGSLRPLFRPEIAAAFSDFQWRPDGAGFYLATNLDREFAGLAWYELASGELQYLETPPHDVGDVVLGGNGRWLAWTVNVDGFARLAVRDLETGRVIPAPALPDGVYSLDIAAAAALLAIRTSGPATPGDVHTWNLDDNALNQVVDAPLGGLDPERFVAPVSVRYPARDGVELQGLLYLPPSGATDGPPPVVVQVHGGPSSQSRPSWRPLEQYLVNTGIAVFAPNVRGSTGFGKRYARLDNQELRLDSVRDLVDTVNYLAKRDDVNAERIAVMGGSYGGYMVNAVLGSYPGVFDAGASFVGVSDWVRALESASPALQASDRIEYGDISEPRWREFYAENSPINNADRIDVPLLVWHGANDPRDPVAESDRLVRAVRAAGNDVTYLRFPDEGHSIRKTANQVVAYRTLATFLRDNLQPARRDTGD